MLFLISALIHGWEKSSTTSFKDAAVTVKAAREMAVSETTKSIIKSNNTTAKSISVYVADTRTGIEKSTISKLIY